MIRVIDGSVGAGDKIRIMSTGKEYDVVEVGVFNPKSLAVERLSAGDVGYLCASIKNVEETAPGDTITSAANPAKQPCPGYKKVQPVVYCGIYPTDGSKYDDLKEALERLKLNDASLFYEAETSVALGFGFRCGFLGLLHMEIIQERLEREFNLDIITTAPGVNYNVVKTDGEILTVTNPGNLPSVSEIERIEEPFIKADIYTPPEYIGAIMELCTERRGEYLNLVYLDKTRVRIEYEIPLNEVVYDFFDGLKSRTRGYASLDYELKGYKPSDLVKLDILLNNEICDALSIIVHRDKAYNRGRGMAEKLKEVIPRQMFEIPIQAAIGGQVISRKKKLLEKQKEGKKRMRQIGSVEVPSEAFMSVLKLDNK